MDVPRRLWEEGYFILAPIHQRLRQERMASAAASAPRQAQDTYDAISYMGRSEGVTRSASAFSARASAGRTPSGWRPSMSA